MKRWIIVGALGLLVSACTTSRLTYAEKEEARRMLALRVSEVLEKRPLRIDVDYIMPKRGSSRHLSYGYSLEVRGDSVISYLPYFGRAYHVPYGGGKGLNFKALLSNYQVTRSKKDMTRVELRVQNDEDTYDYMIDVFDNGRVLLDVSPQNRESVSFSGMLNLDKER